MWLSISLCSTEHLHYTVLMACIKQAIWALWSRERTPWVWVLWDNLNIGLTVSATEGDDGETELAWASSGWFLGGLIESGWPLLGRSCFDYVKMMSQRKDLENLAMHSKSKKLRLVLLSNLVWNCASGSYWSQEETKRQMIILINSCSQKSLFPFIQSVLIIAVGAIDEIGWGWGGY